MISKWYLSYKSILKMLNTQDSRQIGNVKGKLDESLGRKVWSLRLESLSSYDCPTPKVLCWQRGYVYDKI